MPKGAPGAVLQVTARSASTRAWRSPVSSVSSSHPRGCRVWADVADDFALVVDADAADPGDKTRSPRSSGCVGPRKLLAAAAVEPALRALGVRRASTDARFVDKARGFAQSSRSDRAISLASSSGRVRCSAREADRRPRHEPLDGTITIPGDKSIGHRALLFSLLSQTPMRVLGLGDGADNGRSAKAITALGAKITRDGNGARDHGHRPRRHDARRPRRSTAATRARRSACCAVCSPVSSSRRRSSATSRCQKRPMRRVIEPLAKMGAQHHRAGHAASMSRRRSSSGRRRQAPRARLPAADGVGAGEDRDPARRLLRRRRDDA